MLVMDRRERREEREGRRSGVKMGGIAALRRFKCWSAMNADFGRVLGMEEEGREG